MYKVVVGALIRGDHVLLARRRADKRVNPDVWDLPGGVMEPGESELATLTRELHEELGVHIAAATATHLCHMIAGPAQETTVLSAWLVPGWQGTPANLAPEEHDDIGWFDVEDLPPPPHVMVRAALLDAWHGRHVQP